MVKHIIRSCYGAFIVTEGRRGNAFKACCPGALLCASVTSNIAAEADEGVIAGGAAKESPPACAPAADLAESAGTLKSPPARFTIKALESISFIRTNWYFRRVGNRVLEASG